MLFSLPSLVARRNTEEGRVRLLAQAILSTRLTQEDNDKLQHMPCADIPEDTFISEFRIRQELRKQTNFVVKLVECCSNGCMAFTGQFIEYTRCMLCKRDRWSIVRLLHSSRLPHVLIAARVFRIPQGNASHTKPSPTSHPSIVCERCGVTKKLANCWSTGTSGRMIPI